MNSTGAATRLGAMAAGVIIAAGAASALAQTKVRFALDWKFEGPAAGFLTALERGYYKAEGLEVTIDTGTGSLDAIPKVASGTYQMGFCDVNSLIRFRDQNPNVAAKGVMMVYDKPPFAIVGRKSLGVSKPKDLEGKTLGAPAPDGAYAQWPAFVLANGIDASKVKIENVGFPVREPMLASGQVHAITGFSFSSYMNLKDRGVPAGDISVLLMADHGLSLYGNTVIVNEKFAAENANAVQAFIRATLKGWRDTVANPGQTVEYVIKHNAIADKAVELERLQMALRDNVVTDYVKANGMGGIDPARFAAAMEQIGQSYKFQNRPKTEDIFVETYLPPKPERRIH